MPELQGRLNIVRISATEMANGAAGAKINGVDNSTFNRLCEILEITQFGNTHKNRIGGLKDSNVSLSGNFDPADAGQLQLEPGDFVWIAVFPQGTTAAGRQIKMIVENFEQGASVEGKQTFSSSLQGVAAPAAIVAAP